MSSSYLAAFDAGPVAIVPTVRQDTKTKLIPGIRYHGTEVRYSRHCLESRSRFTLFKHPLPTRPDQAERQEIGPLFVPLFKTTMSHVSERLYADASVRTERIAAHKSAFLSEEKRRLSLESARARKHARSAPKKAAPRRKTQRGVARILDLDHFADAFCDHATARGVSDSETRRPQAAESDVWRERVVATRVDFVEWAGYQRRRFSSLMNARAN